MAERIGITMRIVNPSEYWEPRDAIAHDWAAFLRMVLPDRAWMPLPNLGDEIIGYVERWGLDGLILTGGDDLGITLLRDQTERRLLTYALERGWPVLGVCRGMQQIQISLGGELQPVPAELHVAHHHEIKWAQEVAPNQSCSIVNSYHRWGIQYLAQGLSVLAHDAEGYVEACRHSRLPCVGVMWHPEREPLPSPEDAALIRSLFQQDIAVSARVRLTTSETEEES